NRFRGRFLPASHRAGRWPGRGARDSRSVRVRRSGGHASAISGDFDVVYASRGVLGWLPDLDVWAEVAAHFVRPRGFLYITEAHPMLWVWDDDEGVTDLRLRYPYFGRPEPMAFPVRGSYADPT